MRPNLHMIQGQDREEALFIIWRGKIHRFDPMKMLKRIGNKIVPGILFLASTYTAFIVFKGLTLWVTR